MKVNIFTSSVVVVLLEQKVVWVISGVCLLAFRAVNLVIPSPTVVKVLGLCFICPTVANCLLSLNLAAQSTTDTEFF